MLVRDEQRVANDVAMQARELRRQRLREWVSKQVANTVYLEDNDLSPANSERQLGKPMTSAQLEVRLKTLVPSLHFEHNPFNASKKALYLVDRRGKMFLCAYENGFMPEHSVMRVKVQEIPDASAFQPGYVMQRVDLPKSEYVEGEGLVFDETAPRPGINRVKVPWGEAIRGWRTVLLKLVLNRLATPEQLERVFGSDDRPEWAGHTGKRPVTRPW